MNKSENNVLGEKLKDLRKEYKMTQYDIAKILGMSRSSFSKYENGVANPPLPLLRKIAEVYNVGLEYLIFDTDTSIKLSDPIEEDDKPVVPLSRITDLGSVEKQIIGKFRTLPQSEWDKLLQALFPKEEE